MRKSHHWLQWLLRNQMRKNLQIVISYSKQISCSDGKQTFSHIWFYVSLVDLKGADTTWKLFLEPYSWIHLVNFYFLPYKRACSQQFSLLFWNAIAIGDQETLGLSYLPHFTKKEKNAKSIYVSPKWKNWIITKIIMIYCGSFSFIFKGKNVLFKA